MLTRTSLRHFLRHLGPLGLFLFAIVDSSPIPTFNGPDILTVILAARRAEPWYYYAAASTLGSVIGAYLTFRVAHRTGNGYLQRKFGQRWTGVLKYFERWGTGALAFTSATPVPLPTVACFAAAGALNYPRRRFLVVVGLARAGRYFALAAIGWYWGRNFVRVIRHPTQHPVWLLVIPCLVLLSIAAVSLVQKQEGGITSPVSIPTPQGSKNF